ncbi:UNVERIFIED_CONTAM: hypothetical protein Sangu_2625800 [Sesamum angustifolium]|uniref:Uncharacterized protein n=1 Tax=Sesamum angustifolium TaxID=2727405 RepID=A0AAW2J3V2_9LAMI
MASLMANSRRVNLAIPVSASIYEGLNTVATSLKRACTSHSFHIHFVYAWLACYFKTHYSVWQELRGPKMTRFSGEGGAKYYEPREARKRIHKAEFVSWACNMLVKDGPSNAGFIIKPYSPHRFGRQFGYYQDVPGTLKYDTRVASLEEGLRYWRLCGLSKSSSKAWFPCLPTNAKKLCLEAYKARWAKVHGTFFYDNIACLISPKSIKITRKRKINEDKQIDGGENNLPHAFVPSVVVKCDSQAVVAKLEDEVQSIDVREESETSHSSTTTPPLRMGLKRKQSLAPAALSVFEGESFLFNYKKEFLQKLWSGFLVKISNTPVDFLSSIEDDVYLILCP